MNNYNKYDYSPLSQLKIVSQTEGLELTFIDEGKAKNKNERNPQATMTALKLRLISY